jgi:hypothetical protein
MGQAPKQTVAGCSHHDSQSTLLDVTRCYSTLLDANCRYLTLLDANCRYLTLLESRHYSTLLDATHTFGFLHFLLLDDGNCCHSGEILGDENGWLCLIFDICRQNYTLVAITSDNLLPIFKLDNGFYLYRNVRSVLFHHKSKFRA